MRKAKVIFSMAGMIMLSFFAISIEAAQQDFSGTWVLDKGKTHGLPHELKSYTMVVTQTAQELVIETKVESGLGGPQLQESLESANPHATGPKGGGYNISNSSTTGFSAGTLALGVVNPRVIYSLDGGETTAPWGR